MKRLVFVSLILLVIGCATVFAQRGAGGGGNRGGMSGGGGTGTGARPSMEGRQERNNGQSENPNVSGERRNGAQNGEGPRGGMNRGLRGLGLSDEQKQQIRDIQRTARENGTDPQAVREQIRGVLTPEQAAKLEKRKEKNQQRRENNQNPTSAAGGSNP